MYGSQYKQPLRALSGDEPIYIHCGEFKNVTKIMGIIFQHFVCSKSHWKEITPELFAQAKKSWWQLHPFAETNKDNNCERTDAFHRHRMHMTRDIFPYMRMQIRI